MSKTKAIPKPKCPECGGNESEFVDNKAIVTYRITWDGKDWIRTGEPQIELDEDAAFFCNECGDYVGEPAPPEPAEAVEAK